MFDLNAILTAIEPLRRLSEIGGPESERYYLRVSALVAADSEPSYHSDQFGEKAWVKGPSEIRLPLLPGEEAEMEVDGEAEVIMTKGGQKLEMIFDFEARLVRIENGDAVYAVRVDEEREIPWYDVKVSDVPG